MNYVPALDGLRAVAIVAVVVFHIETTALQGGFTGVDVFFVLSGYLITSVILTGIRNQTFSLPEFFLRRIQRLIPNASTMIFITVVASRFVLVPSSAADVAKHGLWALTNLSNVFIWRATQSYWSSNATSLPLLHTWTLAVEEQFYLLFPLGVVLLTKGKWPSATKLIGFLTLASFALCIYATPRHPSAAFYLLPTRGWQLLAGATLAAYRISIPAEQPLLNFKRPWMTQLSGLIGLIGILLGFVLIPEGNQYPGWIALAPTLSTIAVLISIADGNTIVAKILSRSSMVAIGKLSYSIYLWHWPCIVLGRSIADDRGMAPLVGSLVGAAFGIVLSIIAYWTIEQPLRLRSHGDKWRLRLVGTGVSLCIIAGTLMSFQQRMLHVYTAFDKPVCKGFSYSVAHSGVPSELRVASKTYDVEFAPAEEYADDIWRKGGIQHHWGNSSPRVVVFGSSHAIMFGNLLDEICMQLKVSIAFMCADGVQVFAPLQGNSESSSNFASEFYKLRLKFVQEWKPKLVIVIDKWDNYKPQDLDQRLKILVAQLEPYTQQILLFSQVPVLPFGESVNLREIVDHRLQVTGTPPLLFPDQNEKIRRSAISLMQQLAMSHPKVKLLRVDEAFYLPNGSVKYLSGRRFLYFDDDHLAQDGAELVRDLCMDAIASALEPPP